MEDCLNGFETETLAGITEALENYWEDFLTVKLLTDWPLPYIETKSRLAGGCGETC